MDPSGSPSRIRTASGTDVLRRAVLLAVVALATVVSAFAGYYFWDRYVHRGDRSPIEVQTESLAQVAHDNPNDAAARVALADAYLSARQYGQAVAVAEGVLAAYPDDAGALLIAGIAHSFLDQPAKAVPLLERFVSLRQDRAMAGTDATLEMAYYFLGESYVKLREPDKGASALEAALAISPTDADALFQLGQAYQLLDQPLAALEQYQRAVRLVPDFGQAYSGMAECYASLGWDAHLVYARAMQAYAAGKYEKAEAYLEEATAELPDFAPAHVGLALVYEKRGQLDKAKRAAQQALDLAPDDFVVQTVIGRIEQTGGDQD
jgi:tetratricopeptide (TPR) repeat protein